jgi:hypothetical protein
MIPRIEGTQVMTRHMRLTTDDFGTIAMISVAAPTNAVGTTEMPDGSKRSTGKLVSADIACMIMMASEVDVAKLRAWFKRSANGNDRYLQFDSTMQYYNENQLPGPALSVEQCFIHSVQWPETNMDGDGAAAKVQFTLSVFNVDLQ